MRTMTIAAALMLGTAPALAQYQQPMPADPATRIPDTAPVTQDAQTAPPADDAQAAPADTPAPAAENMVNVSVPNLDVLGDFVSKDDAAALGGDALPMTIQLPLGVAASACGIDKAELEKNMKDGGASCTATTGSRSLAEAVVKQRQSEPQ
ncbi:MAG TPA: hypothetical protein VFU80_07240 [Sphingomicrobium sp.]|nr:hypothetical protein [Sphingomicrobium sp.]